MALKQTQLDVYGPDLNSCIEPNCWLKEALHLRVEHVGQSSSGPF